MVRIWPISSRFEHSRGRSMKRVIPHRGRESDQFAAILVERFGWAVSDADRVEQDGPGAGRPACPGVRAGRSSYPVRAALVLGMLGELVGPPASGAVGDPGTSRFFFFSC